MLEFIEFTPSSEKKASIIWLHGLGADCHDFFPMASPLQTADYPVHFIFPNVPIRPVTLNGGYSMRAWYDIGNKELARGCDLTGIHNSITNIIELILHQKKINPQIPIFLAGFSQGAVIAMLTGLFYPEEIKGIIALSGYLPNIQLPDMLPKRQFFLSHGRSDDIVPFQLGEQAASFLKKQNQNVTWHTTHAAHTVNVQTIMAVKEWIHKQGFN